MSDDFTIENSQTDNKTLFERALSDFNVVHVAVFYLPEVVLPEHLMTPQWKAWESAIHLEYGLDMPVPITDLEITDKGVKATLSFNREPQLTFVPWDAVAGFTFEGLRPPAPKPRPKLGLVK